MFSLGLHRTVCSPRSSLRTLTIEPADEWQVLKQDLSILSYINLSQEEATTAIQRSYPRRDNLSLLSFHSRSDFQPPPQPVACP
jgi:hypothetical protein